jgi:phage shock protein A
MDPRNRVLRLLTADIARLVSETPEPQAHLDQLVRNLEGAIADLRREAVAALVRKQRLEQRLARETQTAASRRGLEVAAAREGRRVLELLRVQMAVEDRAQALRRETEAIAGRQRAAEPSWPEHRTWVAH